MTSEFIRELAAIDTDQQKEWQDATVEGEDFETAYQRVRNKFREKFLDIIKRHNEAPVFRVQTPALHTPPNLEATSSTKSAVLTSGGTAAPREDNAR